ncbi:MAG: extensin family protein [Myxococcota bacterium]
MRSFSALSVLLVLASCSKRASDTLVDTDPPVDTDTVDTDLPDEPGPRGFIGSPCQSDADCPYADSTCIPNANGYPGGMCSQACDEVCPDAEGHPVTFCVADGALPAEAPTLGDGACHSRCDFGFFPESGCRAGYGCARVPRANQSGTELYACLPGEGDVLPSCYYELGAAGVRFEPTVIPDRSPADHPELTCHVEDPIILRPPLHNVDVLTTAGQSVGLSGSCALGHALSDTVLDARKHGATALFHLGTLNCRVIAGTSSLSEHGNGTAIDIWGVELQDGTVYSLEDDWEHDTTMPTQPGGVWLYEAAHRWFDNDYWNILLTPNYNAAHDNHIHADLTPGSDFLGFTDGRYIGPAPYDD